MIVLINERIDIKGSGVYSLGDQPNAVRRN